MDIREQPLTPSSLDRLRGRVGAELKRWFAEEPPGALFGRGLPPPTVSEMQRIASARRVSGLFPYESYDPDKQLFFNGDAAGFILEATPAVGVDLKRIKVLPGLLSQGLKTGTCVHITLWADPDVHRLLDRWREARPRDGSLFSVRQFPLNWASWQSEEQQSRTRQARWPSPPRRPRAARRRSSRDQF